MNYYLNEQEKLIVDNFYRLHKAKSRDNYMQWVKETFPQVWEHNLQPAGNPTFQIDLIWNKEKNQSLIDYLMVSPKFKCEHSNLKQLSKFNPNWNHLDHNGNNILMSATVYHPSMVVWLIENYDVDTNQVNNAGQTFHIITLDKWGPLLKYTPSTYYNQKDLDQNFMMISYVGDAINDFLTQPQRVCADFLSKSHDFCNNLTSFTQELDKKQCISQEGLNMFLENIKIIRTQMRYCEMTNTMSSKPAPKNPAKI